MKEELDIIQMGVTFQMTLDAFLEESHPLITKNVESYTAALKKLEECKNVRSWSRKQKIAKVALSLCEDCIEAYMVLGTYEADHIQRLQLYKQGMELATMNLGKDFFLSERTDFYTAESAKSLFHIKFAYATALYEAGSMRKAQQQFQEILNLNPEDNFQVHHYLYALSLYFEEYESCRELLSKFDQQTTMDVYVLFLLYSKQENAKQAAQMIPALKVANRYLYDLLTYRSMNMLSQCKVALPGSEEEAAYSYHILHKVIQTMEYLHIFLVKHEDK